MTLSMLLPSLQVTFCDIYVRQFGDVIKPFTVQCVLMINMFAEKIYIFLWLWSVVLIGVAVLNLFSWLYRTLFMPSKVRLVRDALKVGPCGLLRTEGEGL